MFATPAYAATTGAAAGAGFAGIASFAPLILIFVVGYFLLIRPQQQRAKELKLKQSGLRRGDRIVTAGGIIGTIARVINDDEVEVQIAEGVKIKVVRSTISTVLAKTEPASSTKPEPDEADDTADTEMPAKKRRTPAK